jgi:hypothetical protein
MIIESSNDMKYTSLLFLSLLSTITAIYGQEKKIETDRPGETQTPGLTKKGFIQAEIGMERIQQNKEDYSLFHPAMQLKFGLSDQFEVRAEVTAETEKAYSNKEFKYGIRPIEIGLKAKLLEEKGIRPSTSFYTQVGIPSFASEDHQTPHAIPKVRLLMESNLSEKLHLNYNVGAEWDGEQTAPQWIFTIAPEMDLGEKWEVFLEVFGYIQKTKSPQQHIDGGFGYYVSNSVKLDLYGGVGLTPDAPSYFISTGLSFRLKP